MAETINWAALLLTIMASVGLLLSRDWHWRIGFLATQYLCAFFMLQTHWPISMAASKLVAGWMACVVLGIARLNSEKRGEEDLSIPQGRLFHLLISFIILVVTFAVSLRVTTWLGISLPIAWGSLVLMGLGLLQLGITLDPFRVVIGLLTILCGFEILYATVESSILVTALLAVVNLGLALTGAFFLISVEEERI